MSDSTPSEADLGPAEAYEKLPASITLDGAGYWLVRNEEGEYRLFLSLCPHAGGSVIPHDNIFFCPLHYWTFEQSDGMCRNVSGERLMERTIEHREDGRLYAVGGDF